MGWHFGYDIAVAVLTTPTAAFKYEENPVCIYLGLISVDKFPFVSQDSHAMMAYAGSKVPGNLHYKSIFAVANTMQNQDCVPKVGIAKDKKSRGCVMQHSFHSTV